jgi:phosphatidylglycerol:prolipoprotein diacylglycerol transferase
VRQTLFYIPHEILGTPVFGLGWLLIAWGVLGFAWLTWLLLRQGWNNDTRSTLPVLLVIGAAICLVAPLLEERDASGVVIGLPIRGYGVMLLLGFVFGVGLAVYRARQMGVDPELIFSLAFWMFLAGITGARMFYIIQFWQQFERASISQTLGAMLNVTQGGLVVYGAVIGGLAGAFYFLRQRELPMLAIADLIAPAMLLGLAFGRIGCFLNGCCFGGLCDHQALAISFPFASPPYVHQQSVGLLYGIRIGRDGQRGAADLPVVISIRPGSSAASSGLRVGDIIQAINGRRLDNSDADDHQQTDPLEQARTELQTSGPRISLTTTDGRSITWSINALPRHSLPIHPTQIYSAINAALLCFFLWVYYPFRRHDGEVFALLLIVYPVTRFMLEVIRDDVGGLFGTTLTISQFVSICLFVVGVSLWVYVARRPAGSVLPQATHV